MTEPEQTEPPKKRSHWLRNTLIVLLSLLILFFWGLFFGFNYFGDKLLRKYLQEKIYTASHGLYTINFSSMHLNILNGKISIQDFELSPDTAIYKQLKSQGKIRTALYRISFSSLSVDRLYLLLAYHQRRLVARELKLIRPKVLIMGYPDTAKINKNRFNLIYEDIYPLVRQAFRDFHIDSVKVEHGFMLSSGSGNPRQLSQGEYEFSARLRDVSINPFSFYNKNRVFYSTDIDLIIYNFEYSLADSLYFIKAGEVGFSLTRSTLYGKNLSLKPNFQKKHLHQVHPGDFFQLSLPSFSIDGIDLNQVLADRIVHVGKVDLHKFSLKVFRNMQVIDQRKTGRKTKKKLEIADLFTIISGELKSVSIDSFLLKKASFEYFNKLTDRNPDLRIAEVNLELTGFCLDSLAHRNKEKIFYSSQIELELNNFTLKLKDEIHTLNAGLIRLSTLKKRIEVQEAVISPDQIKNREMGIGKKNTVSFYLPGMVFSSISLKKVFNYRVFDFDRLEMSEPDLKFIQFHKSRKKDPRFKKASDFFEEENNEVVYNLIKKYIILVRGKEIRIERGFFAFGHHVEDLDKKVISAAFDLQMFDLLIDSAHGMNQEGYFYSRDFDLDLHSLNYLSPDSLDHFRAERIHVVTRDSLIEASELQFIKTADPVIFDALRAKTRNLSIDFYLKNLVLTGLNHKKLFLDKVLKANHVLFDKPSLIIKTEKAEPGSDMIAGPVMENPGNQIRTLEVSSLNVRQGSFSYDGYEDKKASYFSLKDIDFRVQGAMVHLPSKGAHDGVIRFDSLQLSVFPFHAVIADSTYALECSSLKVHSYPVSINAEGLRLIPLKPFSPASDKNMLFTANIPRLNLTGFYFDKAIFDKNWIIEKIEAINPSLFVEMKPVKKSSRGIRLPLLMKSLKVYSVQFFNASIGVNIHKADTVSGYRLKEVCLRVQNFAIDSVTRAHPEQAPLFNSEDITLSARGFSWITADSMNTFSFKGFGFSTRQGNAWIDTISLIPRYSKAEYSKKAGYQKDRIEVYIPGIKLEKIDYRKLIRDTVLHVGLLQTRGFSIEDYRDKREPFPVWQRPPMPVDALRKIKFPFIIDTVQASGGYAAYEEQTGAEPGRVFFDSLCFTLTNCTNLPSGLAAMDVHSNSRLMGQAPLDARYHFFLEHPRDSFTFQANMGRLDLRNINPMLSKLMPVSIRNGTAEQTEIRFFRANDSTSRGTLNIWFSNIDIRICPTSKDFLHKAQKTIETLVANWIVSDNNPNEEGKFRQGVICFDRDRSKGFFNFIWKSTLSGIKSSAGFNTKLQREILRSEKKQKRGKSHGK